MFVLGHHLFVEAHGFPRAKLSENCSLLGTDNVRDKYPSMLSRQMEAIVYTLKSDARFLKYSYFFIPLNCLTVAEFGQYTMRHVIMNSLQ